MMSVVLDTHAAIWYVVNRKKLSANALSAIRRTVDRGNPVFVSAISLVETIYLLERGRIAPEASDLLQKSLRDPMSGLLVQPLDEDIARALQQIPWSAVPEMPDCIIAATALHLGIPLITRDERLQNAGLNTIW